jgi:hypothetical protein
MTDYEPGYYVVQNPGRHFYLLYKDKQTWRDMSGYDRLPDNYIVCAGPWRTMDDLCEVLIAAQKLEVKA